MHWLLFSLVLTPSETPDFRKLFGGDEGCFIMKELPSGRTIAYNSSRAKRRFPPCSTFKIPHTVFALDAGVAKPDEVFPWDGIPKRMTPWNADQTFPLAMSNSTVWVYEELARRLGRERSRQYVQCLQYGNQDVSGFPGAYWLMSSLKISAAEQVAVLEGLVRDRWPFKKSSLTFAKSLLKVEEGSGYRYFGKTGSGIEGWPKGVEPAGYVEEDPKHSQIGWWVGWIERGRQRWVYAANYSGRNAMGHRLKSKIRELFVEMKLLPPLKGSAANMRRGGLR